MTQATLRLESLLSFRGVIAAALLYGAVNAALTLAAGPALALDDVKLNVLTQSLQAGYLPDNPPLFEWTLLLFQQALGPTLASFVFVKTLFLILTAAFTFLAAKEAGGEARTAAVAALALPLIPQFGWSFHQTLTHSTALFAATAFFWFALLRLQRGGRLIDYALLGLALGAGVLSKYSFAGAAAAALAAALLHAPLRKAVLSPKLFIAGAVAGLIAAPHLLWAMSDNSGAAAYVGERLTAQGGHAQRAAKGLGAVIWAVISFFAPAAIAAALASKGKAGETPRGARSVLSDAAFLSVAALLAAVAVLGISNFQERYAIPFLYPGFLWLMVTLGGLAAAKGRSLIAAVSLALAVLFAAARTAEIARPGKPFCDDCRQHIPYAYLQAALESRQLQNATLVGFDDHTAGNLRRMFPRARVLSSHQSFYTPPPSSEAGDCYFIWSIGLSPPPPQSAIDQLDSNLFERAGGAWRSRMNGEQGLRKIYWTIAPADPATPIGAALCRP